VPKFRKAFKKSEVEKGFGKVFEYGQKSIAVFNYEGKFYAIDNLCPHRMGPLGDGPLVENVVICPWHGWQFDVLNGEAVHDERIKQKGYEVKIEKNEIFVFC